MNDLVKLGLHPTKGATAVFTGKHAEKVTNVFLILLIIMAASMTTAGIYKYLRE